MWIHICTAFTGLFICFEVFASRQPSRRLPLPGWRVNRCRYSVMGGVSGPRPAECVFVSHLFHSSDVLSTALCSGGENVYSRGRDPLCHRGKGKTLITGVTSCTYALNQCHWWTFLLLVVLFFLPLDVFVL